MTSDQPDSMGRRWLRALGALVVIIGITVGVPALLLTVGQYPHSLDPRRLLVPGDSTWVLIGVTAIGWLAWAWLTTSLVVEFVAQLAGLRVRLPGLTASRAATSGLVLAVLALGSVTPQALADPVGPSVSTSAEHRTDQAPERRADADPPAAQPVEDRPGERTTVAQLNVEHVTEPGDDLWSLAQHYYGDGFQWRQIAAANPTLLTGGPDSLEVGWRLVIPQPTTTTGTEGAAATSPAEHTVRAGETLSSIADRHLGSADRWRELYRLNRAVLSDPDALPVGMVIRVPAAQSGPETPSRPAPPPAPVPPPTPTPPPTSAPAPLPAPSGPAQTPAPAPPSATVPPTEPAEGPQLADRSAMAVVLGGVGALLAAGLMTGLAVRRRLQLAQRPLGRRIMPSDAQLARVENALGKRQRPDSVAVLRAAMQVIAQQCRADGHPIPRLDHVVLDQSRVTFRFAAPAAAPPHPLRGDSHAWFVDLPAAPTLSDALDRADGPVAYPALVCLGGRVSDQPDPDPDADADPTDTLILIDLEGSPHLDVRGTAALVTGALSALMMELACAPWAGEVDVIMVGPPDEFVAAADLDGLRWIADPNRGVQTMLSTLARRRQALGSGLLGPARQVAPDALRPEIFVFRGPVSPEDQHRMSTELGHAHLGVCAVTENLGSGRAWQLRDHPWPTGPRATGDGLPALVPQLVDEPLRRAIVALFEATASGHTEAAAWWLPDRPARALHAVGEPDRSSTQAEHSARRGRPDPEPLALAGQRERAEASGVEAAPTLTLLGPLTLTGSQGPEPVRSTRQCVEYCAWLLEHPGSTAAQMADALVVAESTRRSTMSRLRRWLGHDPSGAPYLPDAYSGRIRLHPAVTSDWRRWQGLVSGGIPNASDQALITALDLVQGAPLADAAPGQWHWAEGLRTDIVSAVRDAAVVLATRAHAAGDLDRVRWATARGLTAAPGDERLLLARLRAESASGNRTEAHRLANRITDQARELDVPLAEDTIVALQQALEGRPRAQRILA